jgi:hypothetical protein
MKNKPLTAQQRAFCEEYILNGMNATDAYKKHYKPSNDAVAGSCANKLLKNEKVKAYLKELQEKRKEDFKVDKSFIEELLMGVAKCDMSQIAEIKNGKIVLKKDAKNNALSGLNAISSSYSESDKGFSKSFSVNNKDRMEAIKLLARMNGIDLGGENGNNDGNGKSGLSRLLKVAREIGKGK